MNEDMDDVAGKRKGRMDEGTSAVSRPEEREKWLKPLYLGLLDTPGVYSASAGSESDRICIFLKFEGDKVKQANFQTTGCTPHDHWILCSRQYLSDDNRGDTARAHSMSIAQQFLFCR